MSLMDVLEFFFTGLTPLLAGAGVSRIIIYFSIACVENYEYKMDTSDNHPISGIIN